MKTLYFGGSFNPIHFGHLICARAVAEAQGFDRVCLVPSAQPPHKLGAMHLVPPQDRLAMCKLAIAQQPSLFDISDLELRRRGPSYTLETVRELRRAGAVEVHWLIGADGVGDLPTWYRSLELLQEAKIVVMARPGWQFAWDTLPLPFQQLKSCVVVAPLLQISATDIRQRVAAGKSIAYLTPSSVVKYIEEKRLYRTDCHTGAS